MGWRPGLAALAMWLAGCGGLGGVQARESPLPPPVIPSADAVQNSAMDAEMFYQVLIGEMALREGEAAGAYQVMLDAARRSNDARLFRRAVEIALQARAGEQALVAVRAWRGAHPDSGEPLRFQLQILSALNRPADTAEPLRALLALTPAAERSGMIASLPRFLQRVDPAQMLSLMTEVLSPYRNQAETRLAVQVALARGTAATGDMPAALALARQAQAQEPAAPGPALLGLDWMARLPEAESLVQAYLDQAAAEPAVRLAYVRVLTGAQRYVDAVAQLEAVTRQQPDEPAPYLTLGALHLELRHPQEAQAALERYIQLIQAEMASTPAAPVIPAGRSDAPQAEGGDGDPDVAELAENGPLRPEQGLVQAWLMLAQLAEQRRDFAAAEAWLARIDDPQRALDVQTRRAALLARQGQVAQARAVLRATPERRPEDARAKLLAEAAVLREVQRWPEAFEVLSEANARFADDADLLYEQAMMAEKLDRLPDMEALLRRVMAIKPEHAHAHNALGYSLADRGLRLPEARALIVRALELQPGDPFITDSLGWVEYRMGNLAEATRLLQQAYAARPDPEIGVHLGEVLWAMGQRDEARKVWREVQRRDADNAVLRETLARLKAGI